MMKKYYLMKPEGGLGTKALEDITNLLAEYSEADVIETKEVANADYILTPVVSGLDASSQTAIFYGFTDTGRVYFYREQQESNMKRIYISFPERDLFEDEAAQRQEKLLELAGEYLHEAVEAVRRYDPTLQHSELEQLGESIKNMTKADYVLVSGDWRSERRTRIEMTCALEYKKAILLEDSNKLEEVT